MKIGLPLSFSLESFTSQASRSIAKSIEETMARVVEKGEFDSSSLDALNKYSQNLIGPRFKCQVVDGNNAGIVLSATFNSGVSKKLEVPGDRYKQMLLDAIKKDGHLNTGSVTGDFTYDPKERKFTGSAIKNMVFNLFIGKDLPKKLTSRELAGIFIHELGHVWFQLRSSLIFVERSVLLQEALNQMADSGVEYIAMQKHLLQGLDKEQHRELWNKIDKNRATRTDYMAASILMRPQDNYAGSLFGSGSQRDEQAADYFASSFGYAEDMLTGLKKLGLNTAEMSANKNAMFALGLGVFSWMFPLSIPFTVVGMWTMASMDLIGEHWDAYDSGPRRIRRLLINARGVIKDYQNLDPDFVKQQLKTIDRLEKAIDSQKDVIALWGYLNPFYVRGRWAKRYEENLEHLLNNPLFVSALKFKMDD